MNGFTIEDYLSKSEAFCREERQYALFLYNCLCFGDKEVITKILGKDVQIHQVFYEATLMRDLFCADRKKRLKIEREKCLKDLLISDKEVYKKLDDYDKDDKDKILLKDKEVYSESLGDSFNEKLVKFLLEKYVAYPNNKSKEIGTCYFHINRNFGRNNFSHVQRKKLDAPYNEIAKVVKVMMNAKPDIAVYYTEGETKKLVFLECKYCSGESKYKDIKNMKWTVREELRGNNRAESLGQIVVQDLICEFISRELKSDDGNGIEMCPTKLVKFVEDEKSSSQEVIQVGVSHLRKKQQMLQNKIKKVNIKVFK